MPNEPADDTLRRGVELCLFDLDEIADAYVGQVRMLTGYVESVISRDELKKTASKTLALMFRRLGGIQLQGELRSHSSALGRRRARQGVPLESLLRAVRMDFRFIWQALVERLPGGDVQLAGDVVAIWEVVEEHTTSVQAGYMLELGLVKAELEQEQAFLLRRLLSGSVEDAQLHAQACAALEIPAEGPYWVVVSHPDATEGFEADIRDLFPSAACFRLDGVDFAVLSGVSDVHGRAAELQVGVSQSAERLSSLGAMWQLASELAELAAPGSAATVARCWPQLAVRRLWPLASSFAADTLSAMRALPAAERVLLVEAVEEYSRSGSAATAARALFCHRNTVMNRLARFTHLTGLDPTIPSDAGTVRLLLAAAAAEDVASF